MDFREPFDDALFELPVADNSTCIVSEEHYSIILREVMEAKNSDKKTTKDCRRINRYDVRLVGTEAKLIAARKNNSHDVKYFVHNGEIFDILMAQYKGIIGRRSRFLQMQLYYKV